MKAIVTIAILYEVLHPKLILSKYLNCASLCLSERHVLVYGIFSSDPAAWNTRKRLVLHHPKTEAFCVYRDTNLSPCTYPLKTPWNPKSKHLRLLEFLVFPLWLHLWEKKKKRGMCSWELDWKRQRGGRKYAPTVFLKDRNYLLFVSYVP